jgi:hypothetical protein
MYYITKNDQALYSSHKNCIIYFKIKNIIVIIESHPSTFGTLPKNKIKFPYNCNCNFYYCFYNKLHKLNYN